MNRNMSQLIPLLGLALLLGACATAPVNQRIDPDTLPTSHKIDINDMREISDVVIAKMRTSGFPHVPRQMVYFTHFKNKTMDHLDTVELTDKIKVDILDAGLCRMTTRDSDVLAEIDRETVYQIESGEFNPATVIAFGRKIGAQYFLYGEITGDEFKSGRDFFRSYKFTINLLNIETAEIEFATDHIIAKRVARPLVGY
jgi:uncharacterized protein (TIGR02722 family)